MSKALLINSIWQLKNAENSLFRLLQIYPQEGECIIYPIHEDRKKIVKPEVRMTESLMDMIENGDIVETTMDIPGIMQQNESDLEEKIILSRNSRYDLIKDLVRDESFLQELTESKRSTLLSSHARRNNVVVQKIYRCLRDYWRYGQTINCLIPLKSLQGGRGKERVAGHTKRGRPRTESEFGFHVEEGINITEDDKSKIIKGYKKFYVNRKEVSLKKAYKKTISEFYKHELNLSKQLERSPRIPTLCQFKYWARKLTDNNATKQKRKPKGDYERNQRGMTGSVSSSYSIPGSVFEIDATLADVHIVTPLNRHFCIGRPLIYSITDRASRMIAGFYVCLEEASWETARLAIIHAFTSKVGYARRYGLEISHEDWPCEHQPHKIIGDRGEMKGIQPGKIIPSTGTSLDLTPPYRPDMKSIVEGRFKILNEESLHDLPGTTKGRFRNRGEIDPRQEAVLTLDEVTAILIKDVIKHNNHSEFDGLMTQDLIKAELRPTPLNYWSFHIENHRHQLKRCTLADIKAKLLPAVTAKVTKYGIKYNKIFYSCRLAEDENWYSTARTTKEWKIEARFDENNIEELYIKPDLGKEFIPCKIMPRSKIYKSLHFSDVLYISEWKKHTKPHLSQSLAEEDNYQFKKNILKNAFEEQDEHLKPSTKSAKITNIRERRKQEKQRIKDQAKIQSETSKNTDNDVGVEEHAVQKKLIESDIKMFSHLWEEHDDD